MQVQTSVPVVRPFINLSHKSFLLVKIDSCRKFDEKIMASLSNFLQNYIVSDWTWAKFYSHLATNILQCIRTYTIDDVSCLSPMCSVIYKLKNIRMSKRMKFKQDFAFSHDCNDIWVTILPSLTIRKLLVSLNLFSLQKWE